MHRDFEHIGAPVPFHLETGRYYDFQAEVRDEQLTLSIDGTETYSVPFSADPIGRIGIRPWRSRIESDLFRVEEL